MKKVLTALVVLVVLGLCGCADISLAKSSSFNGLSCEGGPAIGVLASRSGLYCLSYPLWTADKREVNFNETLSDLTAAAKKQGCSQVNTVVAQEDSIWLAPTFVLFYKTSTVSATARP